LFGSKKAEAKLAFFQQSGSRRLGSAQETEGIPLTEVRV
jgi:hypothetical protein